MSHETKEYFPVQKIVYDPKAPKENALVFRHYNADEVILGKPMHEWLRYSVCYWHTFRGTGGDPFGEATYKREYDDGSASVENAKRRMTAAFEFMSKLGVKYWCFHDRDIAPTGATIEETNRMLDEVVAHAKQLQQKTGIKLLWGTANLFSHPRFMNGASTNPDVEVFVRAAAQVKKAMDVTKELGGAGYVFWGGREGFQSYLNTNIKRELDHLAALLKMADEYKTKIGFTGQLLIEPKPKEPTKHQYDYDAQTVIGFLRAYGLEKKFMLNIEPNHTTLAGHSYEHDIIVAAQHGYLGSIDCNTGDASLGWDTDQFPTDLRGAVMIMNAVVGQGGLAPGGLNFDAKLRRESTDLEDLFIGHIAAMDLFALALKVSVKIKQDGILAKMVHDRYASWDGAVGQKVEHGKATLEEMEELAKKANHEPATISGKQEKYEALLTAYLEEVGKH